MVSPSGEYSESRPFKIFISLLDKWEIGSALSEVLIYDTFKALKRLIGASDGSDDVSMTASTLYEAVEPQIIWRQLLSAMFSEITGDGEHFEVRPDSHSCLRNVDFTHFYRQLTWFCSY